jgi:hypothetical protein
MRYLVRAKVKPECKQSLVQAIQNRTLGQGSIAEGEYLRNMSEARLGDDGLTRSVEICYCPTPLQEELPYWERYFQIVRVQDAHDRRRCQDQSGSQPWACNSCDCTAQLERKLAEYGQPFLQTLDA